jgi:hypothetical protein
MVALSRRDQESRVGGYSRKGENDVDGMFCNYLLTVEHIDFETSN